MKTTPIYMKRWLEANGRKRALPGDTWYLNFANEVLPLVAASPLFQDHAAGKAAQTALDTALYFQDAIAQAGGWKAFTARYRMLYGQPLPFYACNDYIDDEINRDDVCFLLWKNLTGLHPSFHFQPPHTLLLQEEVERRVHQRGKPVPCVHRAGHAGQRQVVCRGKQFHQADD